MIKTLNEQSMKVGLSMNRDKTKLITNFKSITNYIGDQPLEYL